MAGIRITGMASGLPPNIVEQLMEAERIPVKNMEVQKNKQEDKLKLVSDLETKVSEITKNLSGLTGTGGFLDKKFVSGDPNVIDGVVDPQNAIPGEYEIEVMQLANKPGAMTVGFPDRDTTQMGVGYLKFDTPDGVKEVYISGENTTLDGLATQINRANVGVRAQVVEDRSDKENPFKLIVSGLETGDDNEVKFPTVYLLDGDQDMYFDKTRPAQNAKIKVDGFEFEIPANKADNLVPGVTLDLKSAAPGRPIRLTVREDVEVISGKIKSFVDSYNEALKFIQEQNKLKGDGKNARMGPLGGDSLLRSVESALRRVVLNPQVGIQSPIRRLSDIGVEFNRNGTLDFKQERFNAVLKSDPGAVSAFMRGDGFNTGFITTVQREIRNLTAPGFSGLGNRKKALQGRIDQINDRITNKERQLERKEDGLRKKFADLEQKMSKLQAQGGAFQAMGKPQG